MSESIYKLVPEEAIKPKKPKRHTSKYPGNLPPIASTFSAPMGVTNVGGTFSGGMSTKQAFSGFGPKDVKTSGPTVYLKKCVPSTQSVEPFKRLTGNLKPSIPKLSDMPAKPTRSTKNYVQDNAITNILMEPPQSEAEKTSIEKHAEYGQVPAYLQGIKERIQLEYNMINDLEMMDQRQSVTVMPEDERLALIQALKEKWAEVNHGYQSMTHLVIVDTISKVRRKESYEKQLDELEANIKKLSKKFVLIQQ